MCAGLEARDVCVCVCVFVTICFILRDAENVLVKTNNRILITLCGL